MQESQVAQAPNVVEAIDTTGKILYARYYSISNFASNKASDKKFFNHRLVEHRNFSKYDLSKGFYEFVGLNIVIEGKKTYLLRGLPHLRCSVPVFRWSHYVLRYVEVLGLWPVILFGGVFTSFTANAVSTDVYNSKNKNNF